MGKATHIHNGTSINTHSIRRTKCFLLWHVNHDIGLVSVERDFNWGKKVRKVEGWAAIWRLNELKDDWSLGSRLEMAFGDISKKAEHVNLEIEKLYWKQANRQAFNLKYFSINLSFNKTFNIFPSNCFNCTSDLNLNWNVCWYDKLTEN